MSSGDETLRKVLIVDDEKSILSSLQRVLRKEPYEVLVADNVQSALTLIKQSKVSVVISDQRMPDMPGTEFLQQVKDISPESVRAILSGYANADVIVDSINKGEVYRFIPKPWEPESLKEAINQCLHHSEVLDDNSNLVKKTTARHMELKSQYNMLENAAQQRNMILEFTQELLEYMPVSILGVSFAGEVLICNEHARTSLVELSEFESGMRLESCFSDYIWSIARESLELRIRSIRRFDLANGEFEFEFIPLLQSRINGLLIVIKRI